MTLNLTYSNAPIGAECRGINLTKIGNDDFAALSKLFDERSVLCIRDQNLSEDTFINFAKRFGTVEQLYMSDYAHPKYPEILIVSSIKKDGKDIGHADAGRVWHTDMSFMEKPPRATMLHARELPVRDGVTLGDTHFSSMTAAYETLTDTQKKKARRPPGRP
jgi:taurine dioxygenase